MRALEGKNALLRVQIPLSGMGYLPFACATSAAFNFDQELIEKTTPVSGRNKEFTTGLGEWGVTMTNVTYVVPESEMYTVWDMLLESVRRNPVDMELSFTDSEGNIKTITGQCVMPRIGITAPADGFVEDDIEMRGSGGFSIGEEILSPVPNINEVRQYEYIATGGETSITYADLIGRELLGVWRGYPLEIITTGTPTDRQVKFSSGVGALYFSSPMVGPVDGMQGEYILILYK